MTGQELLAVLDEIGWTTEEVGRRLGAKNGRHVRRWGKGEYPVPDRVAAWLRGVRDAVAAVPIDPAHAGRQTDEAPDPSFVMRRPALVVKHVPTGGEEREP